MARIEDDAVGKSYEDTDPLCQALKHLRENRSLPVGVKWASIDSVTKERDEARKERDTLLQTVEDQAEEIERLKSEAANVAINLRYLLGVHSITGGTAIALGANITRLEAMKLDAH